MKNIVLIGMPGSGKSTLGVLLAKALGRDFVDTDLLIQRKAGNLLQPLLEQRGIDGFLDLEAETVRELRVCGAVIATGGSVVYRDAAMAHLKANGVLVYLELPYEEIRRRVKNLPTRGVALRPGQTLRDLYDERTPLYQGYADLRIALHAGASMEDAVDEICRRLRDGEDAAPRPPVQG